MKSLLLTLIATHSMVFANETCTNFLTGNERIIAKHKEEVHRIAFSPDGKKIATASRDRTAKIIDLTDGEKRIITNPDGLTSITFSPDSKKILTASFDGTARVVNLATGHEQVFTLHMPLHLASFSPDSTRIVVVYLLKGKANIIELADGKQQVITHQSSVNSAVFSPDGKKVITASSDNTAYLFDVESGKGKVIDYGGAKNDATFSPDGKMVAVASGANIVRVIDLDTGEKKVISHSGSVKKVQFSPDGKKIVTSSFDGTAKIVDLSSGQEQIITHNRPVNSAKFSSDGRKVITISSDGTSKIFDIETGQESLLQKNDSIISAIFSPDGKQVVLGESSGLVRLIDLQQSCASNSRHRLSKTIPFQPCDLNNLSTDPQTKNLFNIYVKSLCSSSFDKKIWDALTGLTSGDLSLEAARLHLMRFSKPGGFNPDSDLQLFLSILESEMIDSEPNLVANALMSVLTKSNLLYENLLDRYPKLRNLKSTPNSCTTEKEEEEIAKAAKTYLNDLITENPSKTNWYHWSPLLPLTPYLSKLPSDDIHRNGGYLARIAQSLADGVGDDSQLNGLFTSKVLKFTTNRAGEIFGIKRKEFTDVTTTRNADSITPFILSSENILNSNSEFGFYVQQNNAVMIPEDVAPKTEIAHQKIEWMVNEKRFSATLKVNSGEAKSLAPESASPNYKSLWKDGILNGVVITGSNLDDAHYVMDEYLSFYKDIGYEFTSPKDVSYLKKWLEDEISSGKTDYMLKEAHSDGDEKNLFRMDKSARLLQGKRKLEDGRTEVINLIFPSDKNSGQEFLPNSEFGAWIREREKDGKGELVYFNTSCWSKNKAIHEIEAAQSPLLVNIPSTTVVYTFNTNKDNAMKLMLDSFLEEKNYDEIREEMLKNDRYKKEEGNRMIFPDEEAYESHVRNVVSRPVVTTIKIQDEKGRPYSFENVVGH